MTGVGTMLATQWRTSWKAMVVWVVALAASMIGTAAAVVGLYDTPAKVHTYAAAVQGGALYAINGHVEGIDSTGGVIQDEFAFLAAFLMPLLGISLVARATRREEENGRLEAMLGGRVSRGAPVLAAVLTSTTAIVVTGLAFAIGLAACGVPLGGSILYAASLSALAFVFAGLAALLAQIVKHSRIVYAWSLVILAVAYVLRGVGDVQKSWITWLSPLGWAEKAAPFGPMRWWALSIPLLVGLAMATAAVVIATRRDLGSSLVRGGRGPARASAWRRTPFGLALGIHGSGILGWLAGSVLLAAMMGALEQQMLDAVAGNPALGEAMGAFGAHPENGFMAVIVLYLAIIAAGYTVQAIGTMRAEEVAGRLEPRLAGTLSRSRWLTAHAAVALLGLAVIVIAGSGTLAVTAAISLKRSTNIWPVMRAGFAYLPSEIVLGALALLIFGLRPRWHALAWTAFAGVAFIGFLGQGLKLAKWVIDLAPTSHVGNPPQGTIDGRGVTVVAFVAVALIALAYVSFRRRAVPQG